MTRTLVNGQLMYQADKAVGTDGNPMWEAQACVRWYGYHIPPEKCYDWFADKLRAVVR